MTVMQGDIQTRNQVVPEDFRHTLKGLRDSDDPRFPMVLSVARMNGWTLKALGDAVGVSREWIRILVADADPEVGGRIPDVPLPPRKPTPPSKPPRRVLRIKPEVAERLRAMAKTAAAVNGGTPADARERRVSEEFTAALYALTEQGVSVRHIAKTLGMTRSAIQSRLARHGYRKAPPSQEKVRYLGQPRNGGLPREECKRGHKLSGDNLYVVPKTGSRVCRECDRGRGREYRARKRAAEKPGGAS